MTFRRKNTQTNSSGGSSNFFMDPEKAALFGFSLDDVAPDKENTSGSQSHWLLWVVPIIFVGLLAVGGLWFRGQVNELTQRLDDGEEALAGINQRLTRIESMLPTPLPPMLAGLTITSSRDTLQANGRDQSQITITLHDNLDAPYTVPTQMTAYIDGGGKLFANGEEINGRPIEVIDGKSDIVYEAGMEPGLNIVHVSVEGIGEYTYPFHLEQLPLQRIELEIEPSNKALLANDATTAILHIRLLNERDELLSGTSEIDLTTEPVELVDIRSEMPYMAQNGALSLEITAKNSLTEPTNVTFQVFVEGIGNSVSLPLIPDYPVPDLIAQSGYLCIVLDNDQTTQLFRDGTNGTGSFLIVPRNSEISCSDGGGNLTKVTVIVWLPEINLNRDQNILTINETTTAFFGFEPLSSMEPIEVQLETVADGMQVEPTGRRDGEFVELFVNGWMVTGVLENTE